MDERNVAEPMAPLFYCSSAASSVPHRSAIPNCSEGVQQISTRLSIRSRPTSCSSSSTSGRRSTSRRSAPTLRWTPERARLPRPPCMAADRVTVACAYVRLGGGNRSRPFPRCGRGRERSMSRGAGAPPAPARWVAAGRPTKVRSSHQASNSAPFRLISHNLTASVPPLSGSLFAPQVPPATCRSAPMGARGMGRSRRYPQAVAAADCMGGVVVIVACGPM